MSGGDDDLGQARPVAQDQEPDPSEVADAVHPAFEDDRLVHAGRQLGRKDSA